MVVSIETFCSHTMLLATMGLLCAKNLYQSLYINQTAHSVWVNQHQSPKAKTWCVRACLQYEKPYMFTMLLKREVNYSGHSKWNLSKCVGGFTQCCCPEGTGRGSGHIWLSFQLMLLCPCPIFQHPPFCPFSDLHSGLCPQVHAGDDCRVVETLRRHRCPLWPYQQHSAGVRQPSGEFEVTSVL